MYIVEAYVLKTNDVLVENISGLMLRDLDSNIVDYFPYDRAVEECKTDHVNEVSYVNGAFQLDAKSWWTASLGAKDISILRKQNSLSDRLATSYVMTDPEAQAFINNCPIFIIGPAVRVPIQGVIAPTLCMCKNPRKLQSVVHYFEVHKDRQGVNYAELVFRYNMCYDVVPKLTDAGLLPVFSTVMAEVDPLKVAKLNNLQTNPLMSNVASESILEQLAFLETVSTQSMDDCGYFDCITYLRGRLGVDFDKAPTASIEECKTKQECDDLVNMVHNIVSK